MRSTPLSLLSPPPLLPKLSLQAQQLPLSPSRCCCLSSFPPEGSRHLAVAMTLAVDLQQLLQTIKASRLPPLRYLAIVISLLFVSLIALSSSSTPSLKWNDTWSGGVREPEQNTAEEIFPVPPREDLVGLSTKANATFVILARNSVCLRAPLG